MQNATKPVITPSQHRTPSDSGGSDVAGSVGITTSPEAAAVFLSPRVVDQQAFEDFASKLKGVISESSSVSRDAKAALDELRGLSTKSAEAIGRQRTLIEAAAKLIKAVDAKTKSLGSAQEGAAALIDRLEAVADRANKASQSIDDRLEEALEQRMSAFEARFEQRIKAMSKEMDEQLDERAANIQTTLAMVDQKQASLEAVVRDATENTLAVLQDAHQRGAQLAGWDPADIVDGEGVGQPARDSLADLMQRAQGMQRGTLESIDALSKLRDESATLLTDMTGSLDTTREELCRLDVEREALEHRLRSATSDTKRLSQEHAPLLDLSERAEKTASQLASLLVHARTLREQETQSEEALREAVIRAQSALTALEPWRDVCFASAEQAENAGLPPVLEAITQRFQAGFARDINAMASALQRVADDGLSPR